MLFLFAGCSERIGGMNSNYPARDYDPRLTEYAQSTAPLIRALGTQLKVNGHLPQSLKSLGSSIQVPSNLSYLPEDDHYRFYLKLGWDPSLLYDSQTNTWTFDPGDGRPEKVIKLVLESDPPPH